MKYLWPRPGRTPRLALLVVVGLAAVSLTLTLPAIALPILYGGQLYYAGGDVTIDVLNTNTTYREILALWSGSTAIDIADGSQRGSRVTLTEQQLAALGIGVGDELRFGIRVLDTNHSFVLGPGSRNADGIDHAYVRPGSNSVYVGFEDLYGGGDRDYNDTVFRFSGVTTTAPQFTRAPAAPTATSTGTAPAPTSVILLLSGIGLLSLVYRRR